MSHRARRTALRLVASAVLSTSVLAGTTGVVHARDAAAAPALTSSAPPTIVGTGWSEDELSVQLGDWSTPPDRVSMRWFRDDGTTLANCGRPCGTGLGRDDIGHLVYVTVHAEASCCSTYEETSEPIQISGPSPLEQPFPRGVPEVGARLVADHGTWSFPVRRFEYRWFRRVGHRVVPTAVTDRRYLVRPRDIGHNLAVRVRAIGTDGRQGAWLSEHGPPVRVTPRLGFRTIDRGRTGTAVVRTVFPYPRRTTGGDAGITVITPGRPTREFAIDWVDTTVRFRLGPGRYSLTVNAKGRRQTGSVSRTFQIRDGRIVERP